MLAINDYTKIIKCAFFLAIVGLIGFFIFFNTRVFLQGPVINVESPFDGFASDDQLIAITGQTTNTSFISINGRPIFIDTEGNFNENILLRPGNNVVVLYARDRFDREITKNLNIVYNRERLDLDEIYDFIIDKSGVVIEERDLDETDESEVSADVESQVPVESEAEDGVEDGVGAENETEEDDANNSRGDIDDLNDLLEEISEFLE